MNFRNIYYISYKYFDFNNNRWVRSDANGRWNSFGSANSYIQNLTEGDKREHVNGVLFTKFMEFVSPQVKKLKETLDINITNEVVDGWYHIYLHVNDMDMIYLKLMHDFSDSEFDKSEQLHFGCKYLDTRMRLHNYIPNRFELPFRKIPSPKNEMKARQVVHVIDRRRVQEVGFMVPEIHSNICSIIIPDFKDHYVIDIRKGVGGWKVSEEQMVDIYRVDHDDYKTVFRFEIKRKVGNLFVYESRIEE